MKRATPPSLHRGLQQRLVRALKNRRREGPALDARVERPSLIKRVFSPGWVNLVPEILGEEGAEWAMAQEWELVLQARHIPCRLRRSGAGAWAVLVQPWFHERAVGELRLYQEENQPLPQPPLLPPPRPGELWPTLLFMACLSVFYAWYSTPHPGMQLYPSHWLMAGSAHAAAILDGQWYRLATALTLHADGPHLVGNVVIGGTFIVLVCRLLGSGLAWALVLGSGILGNALNALALAPAHNSIGFSTAVFGAAGMLSGVRLAEGGGGSFRRALVPVGAGLGILAMLGAGGENTDLGAHLFGFGAGLGLGWLAGLAVVRLGRPGRGGDAALLLAAAAVPAICWFMALA